MATEILGAAALALALPGSLYLLLLTLAALRAPHRARPRSGPADGGRVVVVVPAHDESDGLRRTLRSLAREAAGDARARVVVVADNCTDDTAEVARQAGAEVIERRDAARRGKGWALQHAFDRLGDDADWFVVIDADTSVDPGFLAAMRRGMAGGADALQCRYRVRDPLAHRRATLGDVALAAWNVLRPRGRAALGLSAGILGNGFALSRRTLQAVPYVARSIVEDVEYHEMLVRAGLRVHWVDDAQVRGDLPTGDGAAAQRARWEGGRLRLLRERGPALLAGALRGRWRLLDPLADLLLPPLAWLVSLQLVALAFGGPPVRAAAAAALAGVALHVGLALGLMRATPAHWRALAGVPVYLAWKLGLAAATWRSARRGAHWVRSTRQHGEGS